MFQTLRLSIGNQGSNWTKNRWFYWLRTRRSLVKNLVKDGLTACDVKVARGWTLLSQVLGQVGAGREHGHPVVRNSTFS